MRRITDLKLLWVEGFMWGPGGPIPIQYGDGQEWIRSQSDTDHNPPPDGKKKEEKERFFVFMNVWKAIARQMLFSNIHLICVHLRLAGPYIHCLARCSYR